MEKRILSLLVVFFSFLVINVKAESYDLNSIPNRSYVIGKHLYTRDSLDGNAFNGEYQGVLETRWLIFGSSSIESTSLDDMIVYYKNPEGVFLDAANGLRIDENKLPEYFEIEYLNGNKVFNNILTISPTENLNNISPESNINIVKHENYDAFENVIEDNNTTNRGTSKFTFKVSKDFIENNDTCYDITIDYFDENSKILIQSSTDKENVIDYSKSGYGGYVEESWWNWGSYYGKNTIHTMVNTKKWKSYTFRVSNLFFQNDIDNYIHLYFGKSNLNEWDSKKAYIKKITIKKYNFKIDSIDKNQENNVAVLGNIYTKDDFGMGFSISNTTNYDKYINVFYKILDENDTVLDEKNIKNLFLSSKNIKNIYIDNPNKMGVFKLVVNIKYDNIVEEEILKFSIMIKDLKASKITNPNLGIIANNGYSGYTSEEQISNNVLLSNKIGINTIREGVNDIQATSDNWSNTKLGRYSLIYNKLIQEKMELLTNVWCVNYTHNVDENGILTQESFEMLINGYIDAYTKIVNEYGKKIEYYEIGNEFDLIAKYLTPEMVTELTIKVALAIQKEYKKVNVENYDNLKIIAYSTNKIPIYSNNDYDNYSVSSWLYKALSKKVKIDETDNLISVFDVIDVISIHPYTYYAKYPTESYTIGKDANILYVTPPLDVQFSTLKKMISELTTKKIDIWFSEFGYSTTSWSVNNKEQAANTIRSLVWASTKKEDISKVFLWELNDFGTNINETEDNFGLVRLIESNNKNKIRNEELTAKNSYVAINMFNYMLANAKFDEFLGEYTKIEPPKFQDVGQDYQYESSDNNKYVYKFSTTDKNIIVAWNNKNTSDIMNLNLSGKDIKVYDMYGNLINEFDTQNIAVEIDSNPIYIIY